MSKKKEHPISNSLRFIPNNIGITQLNGVSLHLLLSLGLLQSFFGIQDVSVKLWKLKNIFLRSDISCGWLVYSMSSFVGLFKARFINNYGFQFSTIIFRPPF